ncbi:MAG: hypothetical protein IID46_16005 [Planctomycetes bacterium]|nr:hypothetical protein [Planctomycetota bacterium]
MQTRLAYTFDLSDKDCLSVTRCSNSVNLMVSGFSSEEVNVEFRPVHLPELRELIVELEMLETKQRLEEQQSRWEDERAKTKESGVPV